MYFVLPSSSLRFRKKQIWADLSRKKVAEKVSVAKIKMEYIYIIYKKKIIYTLIKWSVLR